VVLAKSLTSFHFKFSKLSDPQAVTLPPVRTVSVVDIRWRRRKLASANGRLEVGNSRCTNLRNVHGEVSASKHELWPVSQSFAWPSGSERVGRLTCTTLSMSNRHDGKLGSVAIKNFLFERQDTVRCGSNVCWKRTMRAEPGPVREEHCRATAQL
jgi:hypothetical protein